MGIINAYNLEYPLAIAKKDEESATKFPNYERTYHVHHGFPVVELFDCYFYIGSRKLGLMGVWCMILYTVIEASSIEEAKKCAELDLNPLDGQGALGRFLLCSLALPFFFGMIGLVIEPFEPVIFHGLL